MTQDEHEEFKTELERIQYRLLNKHAELNNNIIGIENDLRILKQKRDLIVKKIEVIRELGKYDAE